MDIALLEKALENDNNIGIIHTNIQEIKARKNDILQQLGLKAEELKTYHQKLKDYRYIDNIQDLKFGATIRSINLLIMKQKEQGQRLNSPAMLTDIKECDKGLAIVLRTFNRHYITLYLEENLLFQKINQEEQILLKAIKQLY